MSTPTNVLYKDDQIYNKSMAEKKLNETTTKEINKKTELVWVNIILATYAHIGSLYGFYLIFTSAKIATTVFAIFLSVITQIGVTAGAHRLWSHRAYKANLPLRLLLTVMQTLAFEYTIINWARDHRVHHKYSDTNADPHNSTRGFFYCHIGWIFLRKNAEVIKKGKGIDLSDLYADPILRFQHKYFFYIAPFSCFFLPVIIAMHYWDETFNNAFYITAVLRYVFTINSTFLINSFAHMFGNKPYDRNIQPTQNKIVSVLTMGEGWHNYHHAFPWDYKAAELGHYSFNYTTAFIDFFAWIGWAYDLKTISPDIIKARVQRTGDGSHSLWGWNDKDISKQDQEATIITYKDM